MRFWFLFVTCFWLTNHILAQTEFIGPVNFNLALGKPETADGGLTVIFQEVNSQVVNIDQATLPDHPPKSLKKRIFTLELMVSNNGKSDIAIYDWGFNAICPENNLGLEWQENSRVPITTAYIPSGEYIVLKPGERKLLQAVPTDFFWCLSTNDSSLLKSPKFVKAIVICGLLKVPNQATTIINPLLLQLIHEYHDLLENNEVAKAEEKKALIFEIASVEPEEQQINILNMLEVPVKKEDYSLRKETKELAYPEGLNIPNDKANLNNTQTNASNYFGVAWYFLQSDKPLQFRMSLSRQEGEVGYLKLQVRLNKNVGVYCNTPICEGYLWLMSYTAPDGTVKRHQFYFPNSFDGVYALPFEVPVSFKTLPNGLKPFWNEEKDLVFYLNTATNEEQQAYLIYNCVDNKMTNYNQHRCSGFEMEEAVVVK
jgi:hypothetical protein